MKKVAITQSNYIPWKGYFETIYRMDEFILYDDVQYTRRDWRNRNLIKTPNGLLWLTIPVEVKGKYHQLINETVISDPTWKIHHWKTLQTFYARAPYFKEVSSFFEELYLNCNEKYLSAINYRFLTAICSLLGITTPITRSSDYQLIGDKSERLLNICLQCSATDYYSGPSAQSYLNVSIFEQKNVRIHWLDYNGYPEYPQLYPPFEHAVSILDLIFNVGPANAKNYFIRNTCND
ncbi:MAG: WbqC family protein [Chitinophagales bacterium]|nr:WbqC family protein [Chitinophagales bacterium]MDW8418236.1 WbqC family protein [Chitinophagales bacterium]